MVSFATAVAGNGLDETEFIRASPIGSTESLSKFLAYFEQKKPIYTLRPDPYSCDIRRKCSDLGRIVFGIAIVVMDISIANFEEVLLNVRLRVWHRKIDRYQII